MGEKVQSHKTAVLTPCNILFRFLSNCMEKLALIFLELRFACFLNNRGNPRSPVLLHTLTTLHTPQLSSLPSSWSLPFFGCSSFFLFFIWKRDSVTAFPACRLEPGERELCYSLRLQLSEEVTTSSPDPVHILRQTHAPFRTWPQQQQSNSQGCF